MSDKSRHPSEGQLWARAKSPAQPSAPPPAPDIGDEQPGPDMMAAYLEGRLDEAGAAEIEAWLARDPLARQTLLQALSSEEAEDAPERLTASAQDIVGAPTRPNWRNPSWLRPAPALAGAVCAGVIALVGAFELGSATQGAIIDTDARVAAAVWSAELPTNKPS